MATFTDFKNNFYSRVTDVTLFDCGEINLIKVVLDGLKVDYVGRNIDEPNMFINGFLVKRILNKFRYQTKIKKAKNIVCSNTKNNTYLIFDVCRVVYDGEKKSTYFDTILNELGKENCTTVIENSNATFLHHNVTNNDIYFAFYYDKCNHEELQFKKDLKQSFELIYKSTIFSKTELINIQIAYSKFFKEFVIWNRFLKLYTFSYFLFVCHYHKEGQLYALKKNKIKCIELQHGLISIKDIFYCFPKAINTTLKDTLFADEIFVYGNYWKNILLTGNEYTNEKIRVVGDYTYTKYRTYNETINMLKVKHYNKTVLLISTQTSLHYYFIKYINEITTKCKKNNFENYHIIVKPHPVEDVSIYENAFNQNKNISILQYPIEVLLSLANIHLSIYSTTLFTASKFDVLNYALNEPDFTDYVSEICNAGIANKIEVTENIFKAFQIQQNSIINSKLYFDTYSGIKQFLCKQ